MRYEPHEDLFIKLSDIAGRVKEAIARDNIEIVVNLIKEHRNVMKMLNDAGFSSNPQLLGSAITIQNQVSKLIAEIDNQKRVLSNRMNAETNQAHNLSSSENVPFFLDIQL